MQLNVLNDLAKAKRRWTEKCYTLGKSELCLLVYVDDLLWMVREAKGLDLIVMSIFLLEVLGLPFAEKVQGGIDVEWVGFELCLKGARLGLSEVRAQWLIEWLATTAPWHSENCETCLLGWRHCPFKEIRWSAIAPRPHCFPVVCSRRATYAPTSAFRDAKGYNSSLCFTGGK